MFMIYSIEEIKKIVIPIAKEYGIARISLFGSYAKQKATNDSDIDFIIDKGDLVGIQYFSLLNELEDVFHCEIDLITTGFSNKEFLNNIQKEEILIYER